ncbi:MAG TPA: hypothetical protein VLI69_08565 [Gammaproteobacteria bacterium]|nr:hypothetical protein [Gammaproteobacteria bacterium]
MAENTPSNKPSLSTLSPKQKVIGAVTVIIFGFIIYEVIGLFSSGGGKETTITPTPPPQAQAKPGIQTPVQRAGTAAAPSAPAAMQQSPGLTAVNAITSPRENMELQKQQQQQQQTYLDSINQLQLLKVKREIAETNQAIASARLATETANKNMSDLLTQPTLPQAPAGSEVVRGVANPIAGTTPGASTSSENTPPPSTKPQVLEIPFVVISVSMQFSHWNAVLSYQGKLYNVSVGDTLFDGSTVASISKNGVTLLRDGKRRKISIQATI